MFRAFVCLTEEHTAWVVPLAACVCWISCYAGLQIEQRVQTQPKGRALVWLLAASFSIGAGVWSTHFIGMLGYDPGVVIGYEPLTTLLSLIVSIAASLCALLIARATRVWWSGIAGGLLFGLGVGGMHFLGIAGMMLPGHLSWDPTLVVAAMSTGCALSAAGLALHTQRTGTRSRIQAATILTFAIAALHFMAMAAVHITPDPSLSTPDLGLARGVLAAGIAVMMLVILTFAVLTLMLDHLRTMNAVLTQQGGSLRNKTVVLDATLDNMDQGLIMVDAGGVVRVCNERALALLNVPREMMQMQPTYRSVLRYQLRHRERRRSDRSGKWVQTEGPQQAHVQECRGSNGVILEVRTVPLLDGGFVRTFTDITKRKATEAEVARLAHHDVLTGLPNRALFHDRLEKHLNELVTQGGSCAVLYLDLDGFKGVNDTLGHLAGDQLLRMVSNLLTSTVGGGSAARLGGDEFAVLLTGGRPEASAVASRMIAAFDTPFEVHGSRIKVGLSVGIALAPEHSIDAECLYRRADLALYRAKAEGRGTFRIFTPMMDEEAEERRGLERDLRDAMSNDTLSLHYQPQVDGLTGKLVGFEALLRWTHPVRGNIAPSVFIPLAEETGVIVSLGEWVLRRACTEAALWSKPLKVAVNLSPRQFHKADLPEVILGILSETGLSPSRLELEVTESIIINNVEQAVCILRRLKSFGIHISLDDFGTGYASLATLQAFPFDKLKIDRSFVSQLGTGPQAAVIVRAVLSLGRSLGMGIVAEGVETQMQMRFLAEEACGEMQGYLFGKPRPIEEYADAIQQPDRLTRDEGPRINTEHSGVRQERPLRCHSN
ncbi:EAL domain-containing protein [Methylobacterium sp. WL12]|uniref:bifunctional diguanylate cyclase/phosphodiesterase n=1 Tax=Methylobacterium sp. WL12 TaxID=2603890 RepID=UPI0011CCDE15|nr:EAL domain-containing protein [Methylobacterium sp. WL12]TXM74214.1 EAL domain-containing protein [Methylobacterium sp. WL12]